ncbi:MAG: hypothetical protein ABR915_00230 [Thermoguttaceae bacterium]
MHSSLGGSGHRDDRRRRLLADEYAAGDGVPRPGNTPITDGVTPHHDYKSKNYGDAEFLARQPRLTDLVPRRLWVLAGAFVLGLAAIAGLGALYVVSPEVVPQPGGGRLAMLDLGAAGSLGRWFSSLLLLGAGLAAAVIYTVRRHKVNDYQGRYRVWVWATACCFLVATDVATNLHDGLREVMTAATGYPLGGRWVGDGSIWWIVPAVFLFGAVGSRLLADMWSCRLASTAAILAILGYAVAVVVRYGWLVPGSTAATILWDQGASLIGHLLLLTAMGLYARHVILDAEGRLPNPAPASHTEDAGPVDQGDADEPEEEGDDESAATDQWVAVDPPHGQSQPILRRAAAAGLPITAVPPTAMAASASASDTSAADRRLTKAERKALKRRLLEQRAERQQSTASDWGK